MKQIKARIQYYIEPDLNENVSYYKDVVITDAPDELTSAQAKQAIADSFVDNIKKQEIVHVNVLEAEENDNPKCADLYTYFFTNNISKIVIEKIDAFIEDQEEKESK